MGASLLALAKSIYYICFPGMRSSFIRLFRHGRCYSLHFIPFYTREFNPWYNSFSFSLCFYWHLVSLLSLFCVVKTLLYFLRHFKFFNCLLPHGRCCLFLDVAAVYLRLFIYLFVFCLFHMTGVCHIIIIIIIIIIILFLGDNFGLVFSGVRSSLTLSVTLSIVTTLY